MTLQKPDIVKVQIIALLILQIMMVNVLSSQSLSHQIKHLNSEETHIDQTHNTEKTCNACHTENDCKTENRHKQHICHCMLVFMATHEELHELITLIPAERIIHENKHYLFKLHASVFRPPIG